MATRKGTTVYLSEDQARYIKENYENQNVGIINALDALIMIRDYSLAEIKGRFTQGEWSFLVDSLNGTMAYGSFRCNAGALAYHCQDADKLDDLGDKWEIDIQELMEKIKDLTAAQVEAVYFRVEQIWNSEDKDLEEFS